MESENPSKPTELTQEVRFATTMTGGVSLAVWMAGVAREINLLGQASQWRRAGGAPDGSQLSENSKASLKLYKALIDLLDIVVDGLGDRALLGRRRESLTASKVSALCGAAADVLARLTAEAAGAVG